MEVVGVELVATILSMLCVGGSVTVFFRQRAQDRRAAARDRALLSAVCELRGALLALPDPTGPDGSAIVDVQVCEKINYDTESGRWLQSVMGSFARRDHGAAAEPRERRGLQRLRLVPPLPPDGLVVDGPREEDTPAPMGQRLPVLPPPDSPRR